MFIIKKLVAAFLMPMTIGLGIVAAGVILLWFTRRQRAGRIVVTVGFGLLTLFGYSGVGDLFLAPLENDFYPVLVEGRVGPLDAKAREARWIVVLGGGHSLEARLPPNSELSVTTLARLIEGLRLKRQLPGAKLVLSGGFGVNGVTHADVLADVAVSMGFPREDLVLEKGTWDTADEARLISARIGTDPFILISSASHLPRAVSLFRKQGRDPLPSPTDYGVIDTPGVELSAFFPSATGVGKLERAWHEYIGRVWSKLRGQL